MEHINSSLPENLHSANSCGTPAMSRLLFFLLTFVALTEGHTAGIQAQIPDVLKPWIPWVLGDDDRRDCPLPVAGGERLCAWPGRLHLDLDAKGGLFAQRWQLFAESWVPLPGGPDRWPQDVRIGTELVAVVERQGRPAVKLDTGEYAVSGRFIWNDRPEGLSVPPATGLLSLLLNGESVVFPRLERDGRLWLGEGAEEAGRAEPEVLSLDVYRKVDDDNPLRVITRLDLDVSGRSREVRLGPVLLEGGIPLRVGSPLPARLEPDGLLRLQVRPGRWMVEITSHHPGPVQALTFAAHPPPWPGQEVWVFSAHPELRQVEVTGAKPVDPRQTGLPPEWARLPAYLMTPGEALRFTQTRRGDADPGPDRLSLERDLWLDFGGRGYTLRDRISGELTRSWRLEVGDRIELGQVLVGGEPRFITRLAPHDSRAAPDDEDTGSGMRSPEPSAPPGLVAGAQLAQEAEGDQGRERHERSGPLVGEGSPRAGVEVRQGHLDLLADSRIEGDVRRLPVSGWELDLLDLRTRLHLPPGWDLLAVSGVDNLPDSWFSRWTLLDLFLVLIIALAVGKLWGWGWGGVALLTMALIWQEPDAPRLVWLHVLGAFALLRLLPEAPARAAMARVRRLLLLYYRSSLLVLAVIALPFLVDQVRTGIYPQLGQTSTLVPGAPAKSERPDMEIAAPAALDSSGLREGLERKKSRMPLMSAEAPEPQPVPVVDPDAKVQTGPGVPDWRWKSVDLSWSGPVQRDHELELWLLTPGWNLALAVTRLGLLLLLGLRLAGLLGSALRRAPSMALVLVAVTISGAPSPVVAGELPSPELLDALKARVLEAPDCLPACADIPRMELTTTDDNLTLRLTLDAAEPVAVPIPGGAGIWTPTRTLLDGDPLDGLRRAEDGTYLVVVPPGHRQIELSGPLPPRAQVEISLPLRPRRVVTDGDGWRVEGIDENGRPGAQIQLLRLRTEVADGAGLQPSEVPPLLRIRRTLHLGADWWVETRALRLSPRERALLLEVPLIPGERVLTEGVRERDGRLLVSLAPGQAEIAWTSNLEPVDSISLRAAVDDRLSEEWRVDVSPLWHLQTEGIPVVHHLGRLDRWLPTWRPWPGEEVRLLFSRPTGVPGPTVTLDESGYRLNPGRRATQATLDLTLRSSQGGQQDIMLPEGAELRRLTLDGNEQPSRLEGRRLTLPLAPGTQRFQVDWRQPDPLDAYYSPPVPDLGISGVNASVRVDLPSDRWVLFVGGPTMGPAVLFWGLVVVLFLLALGLGRSRLTPLNSGDWLLLGLGLSQAGVWVGLLVAGWLFALGLRTRLDEDLPPWRFNLAQTGLVLLSLGALAALGFAVRQGLLGLPEMQVAGNGSSAAHLKWYQDRSGPELPAVWVVSVPILVYRGLMLAWALWLAIRLLGWLRWGWQGLSSPVLWREVKLKLPRRRRTTREQNSSPQQGQPVPGREGQDLELR